MNKKLLTASLLLNFLCAGIGGYFLIPRIEAHFTKKYKVVLFGDSLTFMGDWQSLLKKKNFKVSGFPGFTTSHFLQIVKEHVLSYNPDTCYIEGGINDVRVGIPLKRTISNMEALIDTLQSHRIVPVVQSTLLTSFSDLNLSVDSINRSVLNICANKKVKYIDLNKSLSESGKIKPYITTDGIHLNEKGYYLWANAIK